MATFVWDPAFRWPPPADILLNYDVVPPPAGREVEFHDVLNPGDVVQHTYGGVRMIQVTPPATTSEESPMTVGDKSANSYGWSSTLAEAVPDGGEVSFPTPGFDEQYTDVRYAETTVGGIGEVWRTGDGKADITFVATEPYSVTVANHSGVEWPAGASIYVFCPHLLSEGHNQYDVKGQIWDLQKRVKALEDQTVVTMEEVVEEEDDHPAKKAHKKGK